MEKPIEKRIAEHIAKRIAKYIAMGIAGIIAITIFIFLGGKVVQLLWNWLMPELFGWPQLSFWQAIGMLALCRILFGGIGGRGGRGPRKSRMSLEERQGLRQRMRDRCEMGPITPETPPPSAN